MAIKRNEDNPLTDEDGIVLTTEAGVEIIADGAGLIKYIARAGFMTPDWTEISNNYTWAQLAGSFKWPEIAAGPNRAISAG